jgi:hypothetical protein
LKARIDVSIDTDGSLRARSSPRCALAALGKRARTNLHDAQTVVEDGIGPRAQRLLDPVRRAARLLRFERDEAAQMERAGVPGLRLQHGVQMRARRVVVAREKDLLGCRVALVDIWLGCHSIMSFTATKLRLRTVDTSIRLGAAMIALRRLRAVKLCEGRSRRCSAYPLKNRTNPGQPPRSRQYVPCGQHATA